MIYTPDVWVMLEISTATSVIRKVFAGWYGGYCGGNSWKLNSGVSNTKEFPDRYEFEGYSGSVYVCYKASQKMSGIMHRKLAYFIETAKDIATIKVVEYA